jgi:hypothetical protein
MTKWNETYEAAAFISSGDSRKTCKHVMEAIAFFAENLTEAEAFWNGDFGGKVDELAIWEHATNNGKIESEDMLWGIDGARWAINLNLCEISHIGSN